MKILLPPNVGPSAAYRSYNFREGEERIVAILFADLRGFTTLSETKLPYDVVFLLNRFAREMGEAIEQHGGRIDKFMGDGVMALFGLEQDPALGARQALAAAREMQSRLQHINASMADDLPEPLHMGIGIHTGSVIVGEIGHGKASSITAIGDVVNTSSRLESLTKEFGAKLVVSEALLEQAGEKLSSAELHEVAVKGRREPMRVFVAREL